MAKPTTTADSFEFSVALCAFRYALGRMTYVVGDVTEWLIKHRDKLSDFQRKLIVREIDEADHRINGLGMDMDRAKWMKLREVMVDVDEAQPIAQVS